MKETLFNVWFSQGRLHNIYATGPIQACILAQALAINDGLNFEVDSVQNQETGQVYKIISKELNEIEE